MQDIRLIGLDLDGTVFDDAKHISPRNLAAIAAAVQAGIIVLPATGRTATGVPQAFTGIPGVHYALISNGASVVDMRTGEHIVDQPFSLEDSLRVYDVLKPFGGVFSLFVGGKSYATKADNDLIDVLVPENMRDYFRKTRIEVPDLRTVLQEKVGQVEKFSVMYPKVELRDEAWRAVLAACPDVEATTSLGSNIELNAPGVTVVPMTVTFMDGSSQEDDGTMTKDEFFVRLAEDSKLPRTSQPSPASFMQVYEDAAAAGDEVLVITIGQKLSGTYQCAHLAAADVGLQVHIVDSEAASQAEALLVREAVRLRDEEGLTAEEIAAVLEQFKKRVRIVAVVDSLKHLQKGGRLPAAVAIVGGALGIKPVLALKDGEIKLVDKGRGRPGALVAMFKQLDALGGIDPRYGYTLLYSDNKQLIAPVHHYMHQNLQLTGGRVAQLGPTIGTHVGPGVVGVVFVAKE